jgi:hypothetical protein
MFSFRSVRSVVWSGFRSGGLWSAVLRPSRRSPSGWVVVLVFRSPVAAGRFARSFAPLVGAPLAVRSRVAFSVPVAVVGSRPAGVGRPVSAVGGLRPFAASVRSAGWVSLAVSSC